MIKLVVGPPGAGKNTYVDKHKKNGDMVVDFDQIRGTVGGDMDLARSVRDLMLKTAPLYQGGDVWVLRVKETATADDRKAYADKVGAQEVHVLATPAEQAKEWARKRDGDISNELSDVIDQWWSQYTVVESDLIVKPDMGEHSDRENQMGQTQNKNEQEQQSGDNQNNAGTGGNGEEGNLGFPADTPLAEMTVEQREAYWKHKARKHENTVKNSPKDYDEQKALADKWREHEQKQKPADQVAREQTEAQLREQIRKELLAENAPTLVETAFTGMVGTRIEQAKLKLILDDLDHTKFIKDDGTVDVDRVKARVDVLAPETPQPTRRRANTANNHQGNRSTGDATGMSAGQAEFERRHGKKN